MNTEKLVEIIFNSQELEKDVLNRPSGVALDREQDEIQQLLKKHLPAQHHRLLETWGEVYTLAVSGAIQATIRFMLS